MELSIGDKNVLCHCVHMWCVLVNPITYFAGEIFIDLWISAFCARLQNHSIQSVVQKFQGKIFQDYSQIQEIFSLKIFRVYSS